jgi:transposase-like protein
MVALALLQIKVVGTNGDAGTKLESGRMKMSPPRMSRDTLQVCFHIRHFHHIRYSRQMVGRIRCASFRRAADSSAKIVPRLQSCTMPKLLPADIAAIRQAYISRESIATICSRHGISRVTLHKHCADLHDRRLGWRKQPRFVEAMELVLSGLSLRAVAARIGISHQTVSAWKHSLARQAA